MRSRANELAPPRRGRPPKKIDAPGERVQTRVWIDSWVRERLDTLLITRGYQAVLKGESHTSYGNLCGAMIGHVVRELQALQAEEPETGIPLPLDAGGFATYYAELEGYIDLSEWGQLTEKEQQICVYLAMFPELTDTVIAGYVGVTPVAVDAFSRNEVAQRAIQAVSNRKLVAEKPKLINQMVERARGGNIKASEMLIKASQDTGKARNQRQEAQWQRQPKKPHEEIEEFMAWGEKIHMTPARYLKLYAQRNGTKPEKALEDVCVALDVPRVLGIAAPQDESEEPA